MRECSYSICSTRKREYKRNREKTSKKESRSIKCDEPARGASGDIGFTQKTSNINGLRAVNKQYLLKISCPVVLETVLLGIGNDILKPAATQS